MGVTLSNPYLQSDTQPFVWMRGNLHAHSTRSDGLRSAQQVLEVYAKLGHQFFQLSDHDVLSDYTGLDACGMILLRGNEVSRAGEHIQHIGATVRVNPSHNRQQVIDDIIADGGLAVLNHPNWNYEHCSFDKMLELKNYHGVEIYNGGCEYDEGSAYALDKWDHLLASGRLVWGFASDDSHKPNDDGLGWNVVQVPIDQQTPEGILEALRKGSFYASSGVNIEHIQVEGSCLKISAANAQAIEVIGANGARLAFVKNSELSFDARDVAGSYIRVQCYGQAGSRAWTQPFRIRGGSADRLLQLLDEKPALSVLTSSETPALTASEVGIWQKAQAATTFYRSPNGAEPEVQTSVRAILSPTHLTFLARCEEPFMEKLKTTVGDNDTNLWTDDCLEIFIDTEADGKTYFQFLVNAAGKFCASHTARAVQVKHQTKVIHEQNAWILQLTLDLASMGLSSPPKAGTRWGLQLCRNRQAARGRYRFTWTGASNHNPSKFGWLEF